MARKPGRVGVGEALAGAALAAAVFGAAAALLFALSSPPFNEFTGLAPWMVFTFYSIAGLGVGAAVILVAPFAAVIWLIGRVAGGPVHWFAAILLGLATGVLAALVWGLGAVTEDVALWNSAQSFFRFSGPGGLILGAAAALASLLNLSWRRGGG